MKHDPKFRPQIHTVEVFFKQYECKVLKTGWNRYRAVGQCAGRKIEAKTARSITQAVQNWQFEAIGILHQIQYRDDASK